MFQSLSTALTALNTAQSAMSVVANNVANAATPGYTRQRVSLANLTPSAIGGTRFQTGRGVRIGSLDRIADALINEQIREQQAFVGRYGIMSNFLGQVEGLLAEPTGNGISDRSAALFRSLAQLSSAPEDPARRGDVVQNATQLTDLFNLIARQTGNVQTDVVSSVQSDVNNVNGLLGALDILNSTLGSANTPNGAPSDLLDEQDRLLGQLSQLVDLRVEREFDGRVTVVSGSAVLLAPGLKNELRVDSVSQESQVLTLRIEGSDSAFIPQGGRLKGLLDLADGGVGTTQSRLDALARQYALEFNRVFATGVPSDGGYTQIRAQNRFVDQDGDRSYLDESLAASGLPFDIHNGRMIVNVTDQDGRVTRNEIAIDAANMSVGDFVTALDGIDGLRASVDNLGFLRITADGGSRFDFSSRIIEEPNLEGRFGSAEATLRGTAQNPIAIAAGSTFQIDIDGTGPQLVTIANAHTSLESLAAELNATLAPMGASASVRDGSLSLQSNSSGRSSSLQLTEGTNNPLAALGLPTTLARGGDESVAVRFSGSFQDTIDRRYTFRPTGDGEIGVTAGLEVEVLDEAGNIVTRLNVGAGYAPGTELELFPGLSVSFDAGRVEASSNQSFEATFLAGSDTSDVLSAIGLGVFFTGSTAADLAVRSDLRRDPSLFSAGLSSASGDGANVARLVQLQNASVAGLESKTLEGYYQSLVSDLGTESRRAIATRDAQLVVLDSLEDRRESISGVNLDEELILLEQYQSMFEANARFLQVVQEVTDELFSLI